MFNDLVVGMAIALSYFMLIAGGLLVLYVFGMALRQLIGHKPQTVSSHGAVFAASEPEKKKAPDSRDAGNRR